MNLDVIILAGGFATRLRPLSYVKPKPLLPILNKPLIDWILSNVLSIPTRRIFISLKYMSDMLIKYLELAWNFIKEKLNYVVESKPLGDAGPLILINNEYCLDRSFIAIYGDIYSNVNFQELVKFHEKKGGAATLVLTRVNTDVSRYGVAIIDSNSRITKFVEKPRQAISQLVNAGIYIFEPEVIEVLRSYGQENLKISLHLLPKLLEKYDIYAYVHDGYWFDIGTPEDYLKANFKSLEIHCSNGCFESNVKARIHNPCYIGENVKIDKDVEIGPYTIILNNSRIESNVRISNSLILNNTTILKGSYIKGSIIGENVYIGKWVRIESGTVIGDQVYIGDEVYIAKNVKIGPYREVVESIYRDGEILP